MAALLCFHRVGMEFRGARASTVVALENIDLALARGEFLSVLGPSGCGKSTLLRLAAGLELPTSGEVTYDGVPIEGPSRRRGFVFQSYSVFPWLTVRANIAFGLNHDKSSAKDGRITSGCNSRASPTSQTLIRKRSLGVCGSGWPWRVR